MMPPLASGSEALALKLMVVGAVKVALAAGEVSDTTGAELSERAPISSE